MMTGGRLPAAIAIAMIAATIGTADASSRLCARVAHIEQEARKSHARPCWYSWGAKIEGLPVCTRADIEQENRANNKPCVKEDMTNKNEIDCGWESRMAVACRHGFEEMGHGEIDEKINASKRLTRERDKVYNAMNGEAQFLPAASTFR